MVTLAHAVSTRVEGLFDSTKQDTLVVLTDNPLGTTAADDDIDLSMRARTGDITGMVLRIDGSRLVNVAVFHKGLGGKTILPGAWFQYAATTPGAGSLKLATRDSDGTKYACAVEFAAAAAVKAAPVAAPVPAAPAKPAPAAAAAPTPPSASTSNVDKKPATTMLFAAFMQKNERQAVDLVKQGADVNARDPYGVPALNWAVMMCMPDAVQALVDRKADLTYQRAPGMTIMTEAGACPPAAKILKAAGAK
jgi:hypothetical protein